MADDLIDCDEPPKPPRIKSPLELQLVTCSSVLILPVVSGLIIVRETSLRGYYLHPEDPKLLEELLPRLGDIFGAAMCGFSLYFYGRKNNLISTTLLFMVPQLMFISELPHVLDFTGIVALFFANRFLMVTLSVYVAEVVEPRFRASFIGIYFIGLAFGSMFGNFLHRDSKIPPVICLGLTIAALVLAFLSPESPYYLALKRRREEAEDLFYRLRGDAANVNEANAIFDKADEDRLTRCLGIIAQVYRRTFIVAVSIVFFMLLANNNMCYIIRPVADELIEEQNTTKSIRTERIDPGIGEFNLLFVLFNLLPLAGSVAFLGLTIVFGRRIIFVSSIGLSLLIFPLLHLTQRFGDFPKIVYSLCSLFANTGPRQITRIIASEIFPSNVRELGVASSDSIETLMFLLEWLSLSGNGDIWYYFLISRARWILVPLGITYTLFFLPETKDLPITETEVLGGTLDVGPYFAKRPEDDEY